MQQQSLEPVQPARMKLHVSTAETPAPDLVALKALIAAKVRADSRERHAVTPEQAVQQLAAGVAHEELRAVLAGMAAEGGYEDIKGLIAPSGRVYLFSLLHLAAPAAQQRGCVEEAMLAIAEVIRTGSRKLALTPAADLETLFPSAEPEARASLLAGLLADERFSDIQRVTGPKGETCYHSDTYLSGTYGQIMMRARSNDAGLAIAELVRERSRTIPKPTRVTTFEDPVFGIAPAQLDARVGEMLAKPEYADIRKLVHPETSGVYLYSSRWLEERQAFLIMDWDEVGAARNP